MRARAYLQRARVRASEGRLLEAEQDYISAEEIWTSLQEQHSAERPVIERLQRRLKLSDARTAQLNVLRPEISAIALRLHESKVAQLQPGSSRRSREVGLDAYWEQLIQEARKQWALDVIEW